VRTILYLTIFTAHDLCFPPLLTPPPTPAVRPVGQSSFEKFARAESQQRILYYSDMSPRRSGVLVVIIIIHNIIMYHKSLYDVYNYNLFDAHNYMSSEYYIGTPMVYNVYLRRIPHAG